MLRSQCRAVDRSASRPAIRQARASATAPWPAAKRFDECRGVSLLSRGGDEITRDDEVLLAPVSPLGRNGRMRQDRRATKTFDALSKCRGFRCVLKPHEMRESKPRHDRPNKTLRFGATHHHAPSAQEMDLAGHSW